MIARTALVLLLLLLLVNGLAKSQETIVVGVVTKENGKKVKNVSVVVRGTLIETKTDKNGEFKIRVPENSSKILIFRHRRFAPMEIEMGDRKRVDVMLVPWVR